MQIQQERFEAWLFSQPDEREFDYTRSTDCVICNFFRETTAIKCIAVTNEIIKYSFIASTDGCSHPSSNIDYAETPMPADFERVVCSGKPLIKVKELKERYNKEFGIQTTFSLPREAKSETSDRVVVAQLTS